MRRNILITVICLAAIFLCVPFNSCGAEDKEIKEINYILQEKIVEIEKWERGANILISLTVLVGVLGALATIFQKYDKRWCRISTAIAGAAISLITITSNTAFHSDYRTLRVSSKEARHLIHEMRLLLPLKENISDENDIKEWRNEIKKKLRGITDLGVTIAKSENKFDIISTAYAQPNEERPSWIRQPPTDKNNFYFVGSGSGSSINEARSVSFIKSTGIATDYLVSLLEKTQSQQAIERPVINIKELSEYLADSAVVERTYFTYDQETRVYRYYTLLKVNKKLLDIDIRLFSVQKELTVPTEFREAIQEQQQVQE